MDAPDLLGAVEIGMRAHDTQHSVIAARGEPHRLGGVAQKRQARLVWPRDILEHRPRNTRIGACVEPERGIAPGLHLATAGYSVP